MGVVCVCFGGLLLLWRAWSATTICARYPVKVDGLCECVEPAACRRGARARGWRLWLGWTLTPTPKQSPSAMARPKSLAVRACVHGVCVVLAGGGRAPAWPTIDPACWCTLPAGSMQGMLL